MKHWVLSTQALSLIFLLWGLSLSDSVLGIIKTPSILSIPPTDTIVGPKLVLEAGKPALLSIDVQELGDGNLILLQPIVNQTKKDLYIQMKCPVGYGVPIWTKEPLGPREKTFVHIHLLNAKKYFPFSFCTTLNLYTEDYTKNYTLDPYIKGCIRLRTPNLKASESN